MPGPMANDPPLAILNHFVTDLGIAENQKYRGSVLVAGGRYDYGMRHSSHLWERWFSPASEMGIRPISLLVLYRPSGPHSSRLTQPAPSASNRSKTVTQSCSKTRFGEFVRIAITQPDLKPVVANSLVQSTLEIGIPHIDEMITS